MEMGKISGVRKDCLMKDRTKDGDWGLWIKPTKIRILSGYKVENQTHLVSRQLQDTGMIAETS